MKSKIFIFMCILLIAFLFFPVANSGVSAAALPLSDALEPAECMVEIPIGFEAGQDVLCYYLTVPARHDEPEGRTLRLAVMVILGNDPDTRPDPLFFAQGGPGGSTIDLYTSYLFNTQSLPRTRDFVLLEQRGTLYSQPALYCSEYDQYVLENLNVILSDEESESLSRQALRNCLTRLVDEGVVMSDYNSVENARDIESLRLALGYDQINLYGVSYGSLLAQHYMRLYPQSLRSVILDGIVPAETNLYVDVIQHENRAFRYLFDSCQADPVCDLNYPDLEETFFATVAKLDEQPVSLTLLDLDTGIEHPALLDGASFYSSAFQMLYNSTLARLLPRIISDASQDNFEILNTVLSLLVFDRTMSYGMYFSVMCAEDGNFDPDSIDYTGIHPEIAEFNKDSPESILQTCSDWNVPLLPDEANQPVLSSVPALLLSGGFDPVTPASNAEMVSQNLSNSYVVTFPWGAHGQLFDNACSDQIVQDFLNAPSLEPDSACLAEYQSPNFYAPRDVIMLPVTFDLLQLDESILPGTLILLLGLFSLLSAWFFLPLAWLVNLFNKSSENAPSVSFSLRLATPTALLNAAVLGVFITAYVVAVFSSLDGDGQFLLFFGLPGAFRPIFLLPLFSVFLTLVMLLLALQGWFAEAWSILRKIYYSLLGLSAILVLIVLLFSGMLLAFFA